MRGRPARIPAPTLDSITSASPTSVLSTFIAATVQPSWKENRNQIARSDLAACPLHPDFSYGTARAATCLSVGSPVHGYDAADAP